MTDTSVAETGRGRSGPPRAENVAVVDEVRAKLSAAAAAILTEYRGLSVAELETLRRSLRKAGGDYKVYKNTLVRFATRDLGIEGIEDLLEGPTAIAFVEDDVPGVARALRDFSRANPLLVVKGGVMGATVLTPGDAAALADIPPREVLLARLAGLIAAPLQQFAGLLQALPRNFAYGLAALIEDRGGVPEAPAAPEEAAPEAAAPEAAAPDAAEAAEPVAPEAVVPEAVAPEAVAPEVASPEAAAEPEPAPEAAAPDAAAEPEPAPEVASPEAAAEPAPEAAAPEAAAEPEPVPEAAAPEATAASETEAAPAAEDTTNPVTDEGAV